jgi:hypothetical protein
VSKMTEADPIGKRLTPSEVLEARLDRRIHLEIRHRQCTRGGSRYLGRTLRGRLSRYIGEMSYARSVSPL